MVILVTSPTPTRDSASVSLTARRGSPPWLSVSDGCVVLDRAARWSRACLLATRRVTAGGGNDRRAGAPCRAVGDSHRAARIGGGRMGARGMAGLRHEPYR